MPFPKMLVQIETYTVSSRIWTQAANSISYTTYVAHIHVNWK